MAKLHFLLEGNSLGEFALDQERITIGRRPSNQIHIDNLTVSGEHAVIVTIGSDSFLEDLNSTNGTIVNGETIKKYVLQHNDLIEFGKYQLKYINESQIGGTHHDGFAQTMMMAPAKQAKSANEIVVKKQSVEEALTDNGLLNGSVEKDLVEEVLAEKENSIQVEPNAIADKPVVIVDPLTVANIENIGRLQVLNGASIGRELVLNKTMTTLGKPGSQVAVINRRPNGYFITHVGGNSLPTVNGQTIGVQAHALNNRDVVELAGTKMEFFLE
ncbi:MAG: FHA domain-containing protein [Pseudomonadota bacterium]